jgi:hypothetical protein
MRALRLSALGGCRCRRFAGAIARRLRSHGARDYGGAGRPWTKDGMRIDLYDDHGVQRPENGADEVFEAGWGPAGAVCVHHVRVGDNVTLTELETLYPGLRGRTGATCTEEFARAHGALVFNRSRP